MSVQQQIDRIESAKEAIATAITGKGVAVPSGTKLDGMAGLIDDIEAGGSGGGFPNGTEWTQSNITSRCLSVDYGNGIWVASVSDGGLYYSTDGKTWTQSNIAIGGFYVKCNVKGVWVACEYYDERCIYYSTDGKFWYLSNGSSGRIQTCDYGNGIWVAVSKSGKGIYYSPDGKTWTRSNITTGNFNCVTYNDGMWVVSNSGSASGVYYSTNGKSWTNSNISTTLGKSVYANGIWVAGCGFDTSNSNGIYYSTDGKTWTQSNITAGSCTFVCYGNGIWVTVCEEVAYYSTDGKIWISSGTGGIAELRTLEYANGIFILGGYYSNGVKYSTDGVIWHQSNIVGKETNAVCNANGIWVLAGEGGLYYSVTWEPT